MQFKDILKWKVADYKQRKEEWPKPTSYDRGFIDWLLLAEPYTKQQGEKIVLYKEKPVEKRIVEYKTIAIQRPILKVVKQYVSRNTDKEYCFWIKELESLELNWETFVFICKKDRHSFLYHKGEAQEWKLKTKYGNEPISLSRLDEFCNFQRQKSPKLKK